MFNPNRNEARAFLFESWHKLRAGAALTALEKIAADVIALHPEYHAALENPCATADKDYSPDAGDTNPFLHLYMHIGIYEQVSIDQPAGIRAAHSTLTLKHADRHKAEHDIMDCLAEMIWQAQRNKTAFDAARYLACLKAKQGDA